MTLHPLLMRAAQGELPSWARAGEARQAHMARVAELLGRWAEARGLPPEEVDRWRAAGFLHDALRDEAPGALRPAVEPALRGLPDKVLHGPAAAARLREEGVDDAPFLLAVRYHTLGHPELDLFGRSLYAADYLEPGRAFLPGWRAELRARMPRALEEVVRQVVRARILHALEHLRPLRPETAGFWSVLAEGARA